MRNQLPKPTKPLKFRVGPFPGMDRHDWADIQRQITLAISDILMEYRKSESARPSHANGAERRYAPTVPDVWR